MLVIVGMILEIKDLLFWFMSGIKIKNRFTAGETAYIQKNQNNHYA